MENLMHNALAECCKNFSQTNLAAGSTMKLETVKLRAIYTPGAVIVRATGKATVFFSGEAVKNHNATR